MNALGMLMSNPVVPRIGWTLIHSLWQGAVVAALLVVALLSLRRASANARYLAACIALLLMVAAPAVTYWHLAPPAAMKVELAELPELPELPEAPHVTVPSVVYGSFDAPAPAENIPLAPLPPPPPVPPRPWHERAIEFIESNLPWVVGAWFLGVLFLSTRLFIGWIGVRRLRESGTSASPALSDRMKAMAKKMRVTRSVRLLESALAKSPVVIGWFRPAILFPVSLLTQLSAAQLDAILAHELAHIRRHDYLVNLFQTVVETVFFYHPAVYWVSRKIRIEREHCCDDLAVSAGGDPTVYARALARLAEMTVAAPRLAPAATGHLLLSRIRRLLYRDASSRHARASVWIGGAVLLATLLLVGGVVLGVAKADDDKGKGDPLALSSDEDISDDETATEPTELNSEPAAPQTKEEYHELIKQAVLAALPKEVTADNFRFEEAPFPPSRPPSLGSEQSVALQGVNAAKLRLSLSAQCDAVHEPKMLSETVPQRLKQVRVLPQRIPLISDVFVGQTWMTDGMILSAHIAIGLPSFEEFTAMLAGRRDPVVLDEATERAFAKYLAAEGRAFPAKPSDLVIAKGEVSLDQFLRLMDPDKLRASLEAIFLGEEPVDLAAVFDTHLRHKEPQANFGWVRVYRLTTSDEQQKYLDSLAQGAAEQPDLRSFHDFALSVRRIRYRDDIIGLIRQRGLPVPTAMLTDSPESKRIIKNELTRWSRTRLAQTIAAVASIQDEADYQLLRENWKRRATVQTHNAEELSWGEAVDGVQVRLRADKTVWQAGEVPTFKADVRNQGTQELRIYSKPNMKDDWQFECDGVWHHPLWVNSATGPEFPFAPKQRLDSIPISFNGAWQREESTLGTGVKLLESVPKPGKHTVRVAFIAWAPDQKKTVRVVSNTVEIMIEPVAEEPPWGEAMKGVRVRLIPEKSNFKASETPKFTVQVRDDEKTENRKIIMDPLHLGCTFIVDGEKYRHAGPVFKRTIVPLPHMKAFAAEMALGAEWRSDDGPLVWTPGRHVVQVEFATVGYMMQAEVVSVKARSNPVEIAIEAALPGSQVSIEKALADPDFAFVAVCEAKAETDGGVSREAGVVFWRQPFDVLEIMAGEKPASADIQIGYWTVVPEQKVAKGERVIWILASMKGEPLLGQMPYRGIKALADTPENRAAVAEAALKTAERRKMEAALEEKIEAFSFVETPLCEVVNHFKMLPQFDGLNFVLDPEAIDIHQDIMDPVIPRVGNTTHDQSRVTLTMKDVTLRTALAAMLKPKRLAFTIWCDAILISTPERIAAFLEEERIRPTRRRTRDLSHEEEELAEALDAGIEAFSFEETPLFEVLNFLKLLPQFEDVNFVLDDDGLGDAEFFVTLAMQDVSLRTALTAMLRPRDLDFAIWNDAIFISTTQRIEELTRSEN